MRNKKELSCRLVTVGGHFINYTTTCTTGWILSLQVLSFLSFQTSSSLYISKLKPHPTLRSFLLSIHLERLQTICQIDLIFSLAAPAFVLGWRVKLVAYCYAACGPGGYGEEIWSRSVNLSADICRTYEIQLAICRKKLVFPKRDYCLFVAVQILG